VPALKFSATTALFKFQTDEKVRVSVVIPKTSPPLAAEGGVKAAVYFAKFLIIVMSSK
jgi:hypothetical protein